MSRYDDDFPSGRQVAGQGIKWGLIAILIFAVLGGAVFVLRVVTAPVRMAGDVVDQVFDADHALRTYRQFHAMYRQVEAKQAQITVMKQALEAAAEGRQEARRVELAGLQMGCQNLVSEYNTLASRADTVIFKEPEKFLPGDWPGDSLLPSLIDLSVCN